MNPVLRQTIGGKPVCELLEIDLQFLIERVRRRQYIATSGLGFDVHKFCNVLATQCENYVALPLRSFEHINNLGRIQLQIRVLLPVVSPLRISKENTVAIVQVKKLQSFINTQQVEQVNLFR
jgi:hypothetical protein